LSRYTHRVAIANERLVFVGNGEVRFRWKDYADHHRLKLMTLAAEEFLRRFLLHVVPSGFMRIRHFGLLANRHRAAKLAQCRALLGTVPPPTTPPAPPPPVATAPPRPGPHRCPSSRRGPLRIIQPLPPPRRCPPPPAQHAAPPP